MKSNLSLSLHGRDWWKPFLPYWIVILAVEVVLQLTGTSSAWGKAHPGLAVVISLGSALAMWIVAMIFTIIFLRILAPKLSYEGESFAFQGKIGEYVWLNIVGILLSIITIGVFLPWYMRRVTDYLASKTSWRGTELKFLGRGGRLFLYMLVGLWAPLIVFIVVIALLVGLNAPLTTREGGVGSAQLVTMLATFFFVLYIFLVFVYLVYKWYVDFSWKDIRVSWKTKFWPSFGLVLGQTALSVITLSVYSPAAFLKLYRYFTERTVLTRGEAEMGHLGFEGRKGFGLIWGQTLLSIVTLGFYLPWAYANIGRWLVGDTVVERTDR
jgi:uncharacterized membrane protein YjgN (DUF898 family)